MTEEEITTIMERPFNELWQLSKDRRLFHHILALAIKKGQYMGTQESQEMTNQAFRGYTEATIGN